MGGGIGVPERELEGGYFEEKTRESGFSRAKVRRDWLQWRHALSVWLEAYIRAVDFRAIAVELYFGSTFFRAIRAVSQTLSGLDEGVACVSPGTDITRRIFRR